MSDEEKEKNAEAEELEAQEQVQDAPAEEKVAEPSLEEELLKWRDAWPCAPPRNMITTASAW